MSHYSSHDEIDFSFIFFLLNFIGGEVARAVGVYEGMGK